MVRRVHAPPILVVLLVLVGLVPATALADRVFLSRAVPQNEERNPRIFGGNHVAMIVDVRHAAVTIDQTTVSPEFVILENRQPGEATAPPLSSRNVLDAPATLNLASWYIHNHQPPQFVLIMEYLPYSFVLGTEQGSEVVNLTGLTYAIGVFGGVNSWAVGSVNSWARSAECPPAYSVEAVLGEGLTPAIDVLGNSARYSTTASYGINVGMSMFLGSSRDIQNGLFMGPSAATVQQVSFPGFISLMIVRHGVDGAIGGLPFIHVFAMSEDMRGQGLMKMDYRDADYFQMTAANNTGDHQQGDVAISALPVYDGASMCLG